MSKLLALAAILAVPALAVAAADVDVASWAFFTRGVTPAPADPAAKLSVPGSSKQHTIAEIDNLLSPPDWFPEAHPPMPPAVAHGTAAPIFACASCHLTSGMGHPESSSLAGLSVEYMERQMEDFRSGARRNPVVADGKPVANPLQAMITIAKGIDPAASHAASAYFAALKPLDWVKVVESDTVPKSYVNAGFMRVTSPGTEREPLGARIIELPQDDNLALLRDPRSGTIAYVPRGSLARGKELADTYACAACHGEGLLGVGDAPHIAGRSPLYTARQLYAFKVGSRTGPQADLMQPATASLTGDDMIALAAYVGSLMP